MTLISRRCTAGNHERCTGLARAGLFDSVTCACECHGGRGPMDVQMSDMTPTGGEAPC